MNILPEQLLLDYFETMSRVPLSQQVGGACTYITQRCNVDHGNYDICDTVESSCIMLQVPKGVHAATYEWSNVAPLAMQSDSLKDIYVD